MLLDGKTAVISGAASARGIGFATAKRFAEHGARVAILDLDEAGAQRAAKELGGEHIGLACDVADLESCRRAGRQVIEAFGKVDILINNAGLTKDGLALRMSDADWAKVMDVDLAAPFRLSRAALKFMLRRKAGRIINIGSVVGSTGNAGQANYAAAKAELIGLTKALAQEVASRGITVNLIAPGFISTAMTDVLSEANRAALAEKIPLGRLGLPADIAAAVVYLAAEEAGWVTGATLHVNGGMAML